MILRMLAFCMPLLFICVSARADRVLLDFGQDFDLEEVACSDAVASKVRSGGRDALRVETGHTQEWPGITLRPPGQAWDLCPFLGLAADIHNPGTETVSVGMRVDNPGADGDKDCVQRLFRIRAGQTRTVRLKFLRRMPEGLSLFGMRGYPGGFSEGSKTVDPANFSQLMFYVPRPKEDRAFIISNVRPYGSYEPLPVPPEDFFPFIDEFGQYIHKDWPGKTRSRDDLARRLRRETRELRRHPGPRDWNRFGGWEKGPRLPATGYFYPAKHEGKWWLVDPEGCLFFSHGLDCVQYWAGTPIDDREHWFRDFPGDDEAFGGFWGETSHIVLGYYMGRTVRYFDFGGANVMRKYGEDWRLRFAERCHDRLRSWGLNTIGNWSSSEIYALQRTPYVVAVHFDSPAIAGSEGYWAKFRDVFDPEFGSQLRKSLERHREATANDPWCIGYFVDNEISWGNETALAAAALVSPPDQPAKGVFLEDLKLKYGSIASLNAAWGTRHRSWKDLLDSRETPEGEVAREDLKAFSARIAETYFAECRRAVKEMAPKNLYLGCRFAWINDSAFAAAARHCDVVSYNLYRRSVADFRLPGDADLPVIIGEWHAGALDRGMFHTGLVEVENQKERGRFYRDYLKSALENPLFVGCHWFTLMDENTTGRPLDGENYQIGFVDVADTPYPETVSACRKAGYRLYATRSGG